MFDLNPDELAELQRRDEHECRVQGHVEACTNIAWIGRWDACSTKEPTRERTNSPTRWTARRNIFKQMCELGDAEACYGYAVTPATCGAESEWDWRWDEVLEAAKRACDAGATPSACGAVADLTQVGIGSDASPELAVKLRELACERHDLASCRALEQDRIGSFFWTYTIRPTWTPDPDINALSREGWGVDGKIVLEVPYCVRADGDVALDLRLTGLPSDSDLAKVGAEIGRIVGENVQRWTYSETPRIDPQKIVGCRVLTYNMYF